MPQSIQILGGTCFIHVKRDMKGASEQGKEWLWHILSPARPLLKGGLEQAHPPCAVVRGEAAFSRHMVALEGDQFTLASPGFLDFGTESPSPWETPVHPANWVGWLLYLWRSPPALWPHSKRDPEEAERPADDPGVPPVAIAGNPTGKESFQVELCFLGQGGRYPVGEGIFVNLVSWTGLFYHTRRLSPGWDTDRWIFLGGFWEAVVPLTREDLLGRVWSGGLSLYCRTCKVE